MKRLIATFILVLALAAAPFKAIAKTITGRASWYGAEHRGKRMANGHKFDPDSFTAASPYIPLGHKVRVKFLKTGKSILVTITDRGPVLKTRIIDLSEAAARAIGLKPYGVGRVEIIDTTSSTHKEKR